jgi:cation transport ATPase
MNVNHGETSPTNRFPRAFKIQQTVFLVLMVLSVVGVGITDLSPKNGHFYWLCMVAVVAIASIISGWKRCQDRGEPTNAMLMEQLIHWGATLVAVLAVYVLLNTGSLDYENTGMVVLLVLAFATFLNGIHLGRGFYLAGFFLSVTFVVMAYVEQYIWVLALTGVVIGGFGSYWERKRTLVEK